MGVVLLEAETEFLDLVYEAAIDAERWTAVMERFADIVGGTVAALVFQDQVTGKGRSLLARQVPAQLPLYFGYFASRNPLLKITDAPLRLRVITDEDKLPKADLMRTEYYNDFLRRYGMHSLLMARVAAENTNTVVLNVGRPIQSEPFGAREIEIANRLHPHLTRAVRLGARLTGMRGLDADLKEIMDHSSHAAFVLDASGKVRYANQAAESLAATKMGGVSLRGGALRASTELQRASCMD